MKYFSTFSGIGGFEKAIQDVFPDWECVGYSEIDKYAIQIYKKHFPNHKNYGDITKIDIKNLPDFDLLLGGSPCQDLSISKMNRQGLQGEKSKLFFKFIEILEVKKPKFFLLENVASMTKDNKNKISKIIGVESICINSSLVSAQNRKRLFWCNWKVEQPKDRGIYLKDILDYSVSDFNGLWSDYNKSTVFNKSRMIGAGCGISRSSTQQDVIAKPVRIGKIGKGGQGDRVYSIEGKSVNLSANGGGRGAMTGLYLIKGGAKRTSENKGKCLEIRKDEKSNTLTTVQSDSMVSIKDYVRKLTPKECERLQTFPDNWTATGINEKGEEVKISNTQRYRGCGNAVTVEVIKEIIKQIR